ncbi:NUDIX domain-containing protein [Kitasatospora sp. NPDC056327]|uniref:NUDIX domain-containing protein n=1 Tax=Kitasatospora sp. NPDC056327 TaxID=3345785 RepID=UPI0035DB91B7
MTAAVVRDGRLPVVGKKAAPDVLHLPGGNPDAGEEPLAALTREPAEELGAAPVGPRHSTDIEAVAALEGVPMRTTVFVAEPDRAPAPAAGLARLRRTDGLDPGLRLAPAVRGHLLPLLGDRGLLPRPRGGRARRRRVAAAGPRRLDGAAAGRSAAPRGTTRPPRAERPGPAGRPPPRGQVRGGPG